MKSFRGALLGAALVASSIFVVADPSTAGPASYDALTVHGPDVSSDTTDVSAWLFTDSTDAGAIQFSSPTTGMSAEIIPPSGESVAVGTYALGSSSTGMEFALSGCYLGTGSLVVSQFDGTDNTVTDFAADYQTTCAGKTYSGVIRLNSSDAYQAVGTSPLNLDFSYAAVGYQTAAQTVTFTGDGPTPTALGTSTLSGVDKTAFLITADGCHGVSLATGQTCTVKVAAKPDQLSDLTATLSTPENGVSAATVALHTSGFWSPQGTYWSSAPTRIIDTRYGIGAPKRQIGPKSVLHVPVGGVYLGNGPSIPYVGVSAVVVTLTVTGATASSFLIVYPTGSTRPTTSSINFTKGWTGANTVTVPVSAGESFDIYNESGSTQVIADIIGYYDGPNESDTGPASLYHPLAKDRRILDTRQPNEGGALPANHYMTVWDDFGSANADITAFAANVTVTGATASGYLTVWNGFNGIPNASIVNFGKGSTVANNAIIPTGVCNQVLTYPTPSNCGDQPSISIFDGQTSGKVNIIVDVVGIYANDHLAGGDKFIPIAPTRIVDSRSGLGRSGSIGPKGTASLTVPSKLLDSQSEAVSMNVTAIAPTTTTYLTIWPTGTSLPTGSTINPAAHQTVANGAIALLGTNNQFNVFNAGGSVNLAVDVNGVFDDFPYYLDANGWVVTSPPGSPAPNLSQIGGLGGGYGSFTQIGSASSSTSTTAWVRPTSSPTWPECLRCTRTRTTARQPFRSASPARPPAAEHS